MPRSTPRALLPLALVVVLAATLATLALWPLRPGDVRERTSAEVPAEAAPSPTPLTAPEPAPLRAAGAAPAWDDETLIAALVHLGEVEELRDPRLLPRSRPILVAPARTARVLELARGRSLQDGGDGGDAKDGAGLSPAERGAVLALGLAGATYGRPGAQAPPAVRDLDRFGFVSGLLQALPDLRPQVAAGLVDLMERLRLGGRPVVGPELLQVVLELRAAHPSLRDLLEQLLEECAAELPGAERRALATMFVHDSEDPTLVRVAFLHLLSGEEGLRYLELARLRLAEEDMPPRVRASILAAVAAAAPLGAAIDLLAAQGEDRRSEPMVHVGEREGGAAALLEAYDARLALGGSAEERERIVAGLEGSSRGEALLDIARTDPDVNVRGRAFVAFSLDPQAASPATLDAVIAGRDQPDDPFIGLSGTTASTVLSNLAARARRTGDVALRDQALAELDAAVRSPTAPRQDRAYALHLLRYHLGPADHAALTDQVGLDD